ncbi:MAG TPA: VOC family protein, partial [Chloroflexota bacterium]|nr:VOC family protein [Chloroflexota bacterium]
MILGIDHVGIAVHDDGAAETFARLLGAGTPAFDAVGAQAVRVCFLPAAPPNLELLTATAAGPISRFLERRGEGLHHVCFAVDDIAAELRRIEAAGFELIDRTPRDGHGGLVAFVHPRSTHG